MTGLLFPQKGDIFINGRHVNEETIWDIRRDIGMVFQNPDNQFVGTTVRDDVAFGMENRGVPREVMIERIDKTLADVDMQDYVMTEPHRLSGGQKQRVAIASVLAISHKYSFWMKLQRCLIQKEELKLWRPLQMYKQRINYRY